MKKINFLIVSTFMFYLASERASAVLLKVKAHDLKSIDNAFFIEVKPTDTIEKIKAKILAIGHRLDVPVNRCHIKGGELVDQLTVADYGLKDHTTISFHVEDEYKRGVRQDVAKFAKKTAQGIEDTVSKISEKTQNVANKTVDTTKEAVHSVAHTTKAFAQATAAVATKGSKKVYKAAKSVKNSIAHAIAKSALAVSNVALKIAHNTEPHEKRLLQSRSKSPKT